MTFLYLHGFASGPQSFKAQRFAHHFRARGLTLQIPSLDEGDFERLTLSRQLALIDRILKHAPRPHVLVGSSMGGYLALLRAQKHPVDALVLMAPAVNFSQRWRQHLSPQQLKHWERTNQLLVEHHAEGRRVPLSFDLVRDAERHEPWPSVLAPARVYQGVKDEVVPLEGVRQWVEKTPSAALVTYDSDHELRDVVDDICESALQFLDSLPTVRGRMTPPVDQVERARLNSTR